MNTEEKIEKLAGRETGFTVPDGYFEHLYASMPSRLPEREEPQPVVLTRWQRLKPYVYLAAMFGGIWCMMQMFHHLSNPSVSLDNPPAEIVAAAQQAPVSIEEMVPDYAITDMELEQEVSEEYTSFEELSEELGELEPEYASMKVEVEAILPEQPALAQETMKKE